MAACILTVALDTPLTRCFDYRWPSPAGAQQQDGPQVGPQVGQLVLVPFGRREVVFETGAKPAPSVVGLPASAPQT